MDALFGLNKAANVGGDAVHLMTVYSSEELAVVASILNDADIPYLTKERGAGSAVKVIMGFSNYGTDVFVHKERLEEARAIFESAQFVEDDENLLEETEISGEAVETDD